MFTSNTRGRVRTEASCAVTFSLASLGEGPWKATIEARIRPTVCQSLKQRAPRMAVGT